MAYYRNKKYKTNYTPPNRMLRKNCRKHGELIDYSNSNDRTVYETFNPYLNIAELNCYKCLSEKVQREQEKYSAVYNEIDKDAYKKYGRSAKIFEYMGSIIFWIGFLGFIFFLGIYSFLVAIMLSGLLVTIGFTFIRIYESLEKKYINYRLNILREKNIEPIRDAKDIMNEQENIVSKWRMEQERKQNELRIEQEQKQRERERKREERLNYSFEEIDKMTGLDFENFVKNLLQKNGFENTQLTKASGDEGVDIIAYKNGKKIAVQCKRYSGKVSNSAIQEVNSGKVVYKCQQACVITNSYFTDNAKSLAEIHNVKLIDRDGLFELMENSNGNVNHKNKDFHQVAFNFDK